MQDSITGKFLPGIRKGNEYTYNSWHCMLNRVDQKSSVGRYPTISIDPAWRDFNNFLKDMGKRPKNYTLERKDNTKGYFKDNCEWADYKKQNFNKSNTIKITNGIETRALKDWCKILNLKYKTIHMRLRVGWEVDEALNTPIPYYVGMTKIKKNIYKKA